MRNQIRIVAAAALALGSFSLVARGDDNSAANNTSNNVNAPADQNANQQGAQVSQNDAQAIRERLAQTTKDAFANNPTSSIQQDLTVSGAQQLASANVNNDDLNQLTDDIRTAWHNKYGDDLGAKDDQVALGDVQIYQGNYDLGNQARTAGEQMFPNNQTPAMRGNVAPNSGPNANNGTAATVTADFPAKGDTSAPEVTITLAQQSVTTGTPAQWRIQVPSTLDSQTLHDNLVKQYSAIRDHEADWPTDENKAFCDISRHVARAIADSSSGDPNQNNGQDNGPATRPTGQ
jgi:hypothetical protein